MQAESFMAQASDDSSAITINAQCNGLNVSLISPPKWTFELALSSNVSSGYTVSASYNFKTRYSPVSACRDVADEDRGSIPRLKTSHASNPEVDAESFALLQRYALVSTTRD